MRLLLVEDDRLVRIPVRDALLAAGPDVAEAGEVPAALRTVGAEAFAVILGDVRRPSLDGLALLRRRRALQPDLAVLLMTAYVDAGDTVEAIREGARDHSVSPLEIEELVLRLGRIRDEWEFRRRPEAASSTR